MPEPRGRTAPQLRRARNWNRHVEDLELLAATPGFRDLRDRILELAQLIAADNVLDIGAGTGLLALASAPHVNHVVALDVSPEMCARLDAKVEYIGIENLEIVNATATQLPLADGAVDVVLSNYCFHHLKGQEKARALAEIRRVLRPGGRLVFGDMMFGLTLMDRRDRTVLLQLLRRMIAHGPAGIVRVIRNATRVLGGRGEYPARVEWWRDALLAAGFVDVCVQPLAHEGGIARARRPEQTRNAAIRSLAGGRAAP